MLIGEVMGMGVGLCANGHCAVNGLLKGYDALMNLVLDEVQEILRGIAQPTPL